MLISAGLQCTFYPWRVPLCNVLDYAVCAAMGTCATLATAFTDWAPNTDTYSAIFLVVQLGTLGLLVIVMVASILTYFKKEQKLTYFVFYLSALPRFAKKIDNFQNVCTAITKMDRKDLETLFGKSDHYDIG